jgi:hypothetical protein
MSTARRLLMRYWSLVIACFVPVLDARLDRIPDPIENTDPSKLVLTLLFLYGCGTLICLSLLVHSWIRQRRFAKNIWTVIFWTHALILPALITIGLGLQRIQTYTYPLAVDYQRWGGGRWYQNLHFYVDWSARRFLNQLL